MLICHFNDVHVYITMLLDNAWHYTLTVTHCRTFCLVSQLVLPPPNNACPVVFLTARSDLSPLEVPRLGAPCPWKLALSGLWDRLIFS